MPSSSSRLFINSSSNFSSLFLSTTSPPFLSTLTLCNPLSKIRTTCSKKPKSP